VVPYKDRKALLSEPFSIGLAALSTENNRFLPTGFVERYPRFSSMSCGKNNRFDGFFLTVAPGRLLCAG
jgi:hypothetical protein